MNETKRLVVLERITGFYDGYELKDEKYILVFRATSKELFNHIKAYSDNEYIIKYLDSSQETGFMRRYHASRKDFDKDSKVKIYFNQLTYDQIGDFVNCQDCGQISLMGIGKRRCPNCKSHNLFWEIGLHDQKLSIKDVTTKYGYDAEFIYD